MRITDELASDHGAVLEKLDELQQAAITLEAFPGKQENAATIIEIGDFVETDVAGHFAAEEELLFPALSGIEGMADGPVKMMNYEHDRFRELNVTFQEQIQGLRTDTLRDYGSLVRTVDDLTALLREHIRKEDSVLFPMAERSIPRQELEQMGEELARRFRKEKSNVVHLDLSRVPEGEKHALMIDSFDRLKAGESLRITDNRDPAAIRYHFGIERQGRYEWQYAEHGPRKWVVYISKVA